MSAMPMDEDDWERGGKRKDRGKGSEFEREMNEATRLAQGFGRAMTQAFQQAVVQGKDLDDVLKGLMLRLSSMALRAALKPIEDGLSGMLEGLFGGIFGQPGQTGGAAQTSVIPFAKGGVVAAPTYFPLGPSLGLAGEKGAEAILPLSRGSDGRLGVRTQGEARPLAVTVNVSTPDAASFRRSEAYLSGAIARAVSRGERSL